MKLRFIISAVLLFLALALPVVAIVKKGMPWGFRGHASVLVQKTHTVEVVDAQQNTRTVEVGGFVDADDLIRVGTGSAARLKFPQALVTILDGSQVTVADGAMQLSRGMLSVLVERGAKPFKVTVLAPKVDLLIRAADVDGEVTIIADQKADARVFVRTGSVEAATPAAALTVPAQKLAAITGGKIEILDVPTSLKVTATCVPGKAKIVAPLGVQIFVDGVPMFSAAEPVEVAPAAHHPSRINVFARDAVGNISPVSEIPCVEPAPPPPPAPKKLPPPPKSSVIMAP